MDDRTTGVSNESMAGTGDERTFGRSEETTPRRGTSAPSTSDQTRGLGDERIRAAAGVAERHDTTGARTEQIRAGIDQTRGSLSGTIDSTQGHVRPSNATADAASRVRDAASEAVETARNAVSETFDEVADSRFVRRARRNPIAVIMVGVGIVGLAWLAFGRRRPRAKRTDTFDHGNSFGYYERDEY